MEENNQEQYVQEPLISIDSSEKLPSFEGMGDPPLNGISATPSRAKYYPGEKYILMDSIPLTRTLITIFWYYELVWGGIDFIVNYV